MTKLSILDPVAGFKEWLPNEKILEESIIDDIRRTYSKFGFVPIETSAVERNEVLQSKGVAAKEIYQLTRLSHDGDVASRDRDFSLHFDLTVPLVRYVSQNYENLIFPFKRYQIQKVWRGEKPGEGRFREFYQCDIDSVGDGVLDISYDSEVIAIINEVFTKLKIGDFLIRVNNRKILLGVFEHFGLSMIDRVKCLIDEARSVVSSGGVFNPTQNAIKLITDMFHLDSEGRQGRLFLSWLVELEEGDVLNNVLAFEENRILRFLDGMGKVTRKELLDDLTIKSGVPLSVANGLLDFVETSVGKGGALEVFDYLRSFSKNVLFLEGVDELQEVVNRAYSYGVPSSRIAVDIKIARGLDYYTGLVIETNLKDYPDAGSICSGGRYDNLASGFIKKKLPGVGVSIGLTRLMHIILEKNLKDYSSHSLAKILVTVQDQTLKNEMIQIATYLREYGVWCETYLENKNLKAQLRYASKKKFIFVVIASRKELDSNRLVLKNLRAGTQRLISLTELVDSVKPYQR